MRPLGRLSVAWKALCQLGVQQVGLNALYRFGLVTGHYRRVTPPAGLSKAPGWQGSLPPSGFGLLPPLEPLRAAYQDFFELYPQAAADLLAEAREICAGQVRLFGAPPVPLTLDPALPLRHWTDYERGALRPGPDGDIKFIWEPARFGWVFPLARAYLYQRDEAYPRAFWSFTEKFLDANPANLGPNWMSAQEVALRLVALLFGLYVFADSPQSTPARQQRLLDAALQHARRIIPTLVYARSQNNNHLITEALGLYTAGLLLRGQPEAEGWKQTGWQWLESAFRQQIAADGTYSQHSSSYHRLMLAAALWGRWLARLDAQDYAEDVLDRLAVASTWMLDHIDLDSGGASNLGSSDGADIFPLSTCGVSDYRPVAQAASRCFRGRGGFPPGPWDETSLWYGELGETRRMEKFRLIDRQHLSAPSDRRIHSASSWASLRAVHFTSRPSHADQLHVDLWMHGINVALDAGSYRYTARPPWDNSLAKSMVHNTITVDGEDQMTRGGRFLWLDWAQAKWAGVNPSELQAAHDGILIHGIVHSRRLSMAGADHWQVDDQVLAAFRKLPPRTIILHWLLPDWPWRLLGERLLLDAPFGTLALAFSYKAPKPVKLGVRLIREGKSLLDSHPAEPILGWYSPTYSVKVAALSFQLIYQGPLPVTLTSSFSIEQQSE